MNDLFRDSGIDQPVDQGQTEEEIEKEVAHKNAPDVLGKIDLNACGIDCPV